MPNLASATRQFYVKVLATCFFRVPVFAEACLGRVEAEADSHQHAGLRSLQSSSSLSSDTEPFVDRDEPSRTNLGDDANSDLPRIVPALKLPEFIEDASCDAAANASRAQGIQPGPPVFDETFDGKPLSSKHTVGKDANRTALSPDASDDGNSVGTVADKKKWRQFQRELAPLAPKPVTPSSTAAGKSGLGDLSLIHI